MYISILEHSQLPSQCVLGDFTPVIKRPVCEIESSTHLVLRSNYVKFYI